MKNKDMDKLREKIEKFKNQLMNLWKVSVPYPVTVLCFQYELANYITELLEAKDREIEEVKLKHDTVLKESIDRYTKITELQSLIDNAELPEKYHMIGDEIVDSWIDKFNEALVQARPVVAKQKQEIGELKKS